MAKKKKNFSQKDYNEYLKSCTIAEDIWEVRQLMIPSKLELREKMKTNSPQVWDRMKTILNSRIN
tara:strand:+ start:5772 stop:5966 length:195 start_codon:yes stop_codon:yes gene_type:complete